MLSPSQSLNLKALTRTLDKTKVSSIQGVAGGETLVFFLIACVRNARSRPCIFSHCLCAERAEPFEKGLALGVELDGRQPWHTCARRPHGTLLRRPHGFRLWRPRGALDMLHRNKEHALKSLHID